MARRLSTACGPWYHGGIAGLEVGDELLPGCEVRPGSAETAISVTHDLDLAGSYAAFRSGGGDVYELAVEHPTIPPVAEVAATATLWPPLMPFHFTVRRAVVVGVVRRDVSSPMTAGLPRQPPIRRRSDG